MYKSFLLWLLISFGTALCIFSSPALATNNCAVGQAEICNSTSFGSTPKQCSSITFTPSSPTSGQSVTAKVAASNAQRVDADLYNPQGQTIGGKSGVPCAGTSCSFTFTAPNVTSGTTQTYKVNFNAWDTCGGVVHNHEAFNTVAISAGSGGTGGGGTPTPTGTPGFASVSIAVQLDGIGPNDNNNPHNKVRALDFYLYKPNTWQTDTMNHNVLYGPIRGTVSYVTDPNSPFVGGFATQGSPILLKGVPTGTYDILVKSPEGSLRKVAGQNIKLTIGQTTNLNPAPTGGGNPTPLLLPMGDINGDNSIDIIDFYSFLFTCFGTKASASDCVDPNKDGHDATKKGLYADLDDDGQVDGVAYNILIRNFGQQGDGGATPGFITPGTGPTPTPKPTVTFSISGNVHDAVITTKGVPAATVELQPLVSGVGTATTHVTTDSNGSFHFTNIINASYTVGVTPPPNVIITTKNPETITVGPDATAYFGAAITPTAAPTFSISGSVSDVGNNNAGVSGVTVELDPVVTGVGSAKTTKTTDSNGSFHFDGIIPANYTVGITPPPTYTTTTTNPEHITVGPNATAYFGIKNH